MDNSELISQYLLGKLNDADRLQFEQRLNNEPALGEELSVQKQIMNAAIDAGAKSIFRKEIRKRERIKKMSWLAAAAVLIALLAIFGLKRLWFPVNGVEQLKQLASLSPFVNPPIPAADVPFMEYFFDAEKGDTIFYPSGSILCFPASSMVDKDGNAIKGKVRLTYREFLDPIDLYLSGIPMGYDSAGVKYNLESSAMCEVKAYKDDQPVFVNQKAKPQFHLSSRNNSPAHNLYVLDTVKRNWVCIGKDTITRVDELKKTIVQINTTTETEVPGVPLPVLPIKPLKPIKPDGFKPTISIKIEPGSFEELFAYDHMRLEIQEEKKFRSADADDKWEDVKLQRTAVAGMYTVTFERPGRKVSYLVKPVLEGKDYDIAMNAFERKNREYELALQNRTATEKRQRDSITRLSQNAERFSAEYDRAARMSALIELRNNKKNGKSMISSNPDSVQKIIEDNMLKRLQAEARKQLADGIAREEILRSFSLYEFGTYNTDRPMPPAGIPITSTYVDESGQPLKLTNAVVVYKGINSYMNYASIKPIFHPLMLNSIWSITNTEFYYFSFADFAKTNINRATREYQFPMRKAKKWVTSYEEARELLDSL